MEASALTHSSRLGLLGRRSPLLRLQGDERLIALIRDGQERAFEALVDRYGVRLQAFCRGMLASSEDAEDVLQEVFVAAHRAILADNRAINARPWLYRIARNRCLNHLRKPVPVGQDSMDLHPHENGVSVADRVEKRAEFRALIHDVQGLPETQRSALLLREIDALAYEEIAVAMETTVPAVKSLLVRARISLADASQGRHLTCDEVHLELAEAIEGLRKVSGPARAHMKGCERCRAYRTDLRQNEKALASLVPIGPLAAFAHTLSAKLGLGGAKAGAGGSAGAGAGAGGAAAAGGGGGALGLAGGSAAGLGGATLGAKAVAGLASVALLTAGAVEVQHLTSSEPASKTAGVAHDATAIAPTERTMRGGAHASTPAASPPGDIAPQPPSDPVAPETPVEPEISVPPDEPAEPAPTDPAAGTTVDALGEIETNPDGSGGASDAPPQAPPIGDQPPVAPPPDVDPIPPDAPPSEPTASGPDGYEPAAGP